MENSAVEDIKDRIARMLESQDEPESDHKPSKLFDIDDEGESSLFKDLLSKIDSRDQSEQI